LFKNKIIQMAKSKKSPKKAARKVVKKAPLKTVKKAAKKAAPKVARKVPKKVVKKAIKKAAPKAAKKAVKKAPVKAVKRAVKKSPPKPSTAPVQASGKKFLLIYHAPADAQEQTANVTPEQQEAGMALWRAWAERVAGNLTDLGAPLVNGKRITSEGTSSPSTKDVAGYSLLQAEDWEELNSLLEGHPHLSGWHPEAAIEVHEVIILPGMSEL
jgi:hypothetical protein